MHFTHNFITLDSSDAGLQKTDFLPVQTDF